MSYYYTCPKCGSNLDLGERCDCEKENPSGGSGEVPEFCFNEKISEGRNKFPVHFSNHTKKYFNNSISHDKEESNMKSEILLVEPERNRDAESGFSNGKVLKDLTTEQKENNFPERIDDISINADGLIVLEALPVIKENLIAAKTAVENRTNWVLSLAITEETRQEAKKTRSVLNKEHNAFKDTIKRVKQEILKPYMELETVYKECIDEPYDRADNKLKTGIDDIENGIKEQKKTDLINYFEEYKTAKEVDFLKFEDLGINVTLSASVKSLKKKISEYCDKVAGDFEAMLSLENRDEIIREYKTNGHRLSTAMDTVNRRHKSIEDEKARTAALLERKRQAAEAANRTLNNMEAVTKQAETIVQPATAVMPAEPVLIKAPEAEEDFPISYSLSFTLNFMCKPSELKAKMTRLKEFFAKEEMSYVSE